MGKGLVVVLSAVLLFACSALGDCLHAKGLHASDPQPLVLAQPVTAPHP
jgi:hypothetical protein